LLREAATAAQEAETALLQSAKLAQALEELGAAKGRLPDGDEKSEARLLGEEVKDVRTRVRALAEEVQDIRVRVTALADRLSPP
jgi:hypothetical protein